MSEALKIFTSVELSPGQVIQCHMNGYNGVFQKITQDDLNNFKKHRSGLIHDPKTFFHSEFSLLSNADGSAVEKKSFTFSSLTKKDELFSQLEAFTESLPGSAAKEAATVVFQELYMNAVFDAPQEAKRLGYSLGTRSDSCYFHIHQTAEDIAIVCEDPHGSLDTNHLMRRMNKVYEAGVGESIEKRDGKGAGIGCVLLFEQVEELVVGVIPNQQTRVACVFPLKKSFRQKAQIKKSLLRIEI